MSARREASQPPVIPGYDYVRLLGTGGFADVFLYRQQMPRRRVAVKVLLAASLDDEARARFRTEADIMASLSHHPSIVTVYQADVAADGRPVPGDGVLLTARARPALPRRADGCGGGAPDRHPAELGGRDRAPRGHPAPGHQARERAGHRLRVAGADRLRDRRHRRARERRDGRHVDPLVAAGDAHRRTDRGRALRRVLAGRDDLLAAGPAVAVRGARRVEQRRRPDLPDRAWRSWRPPGAATCRTPSRRSWPARWPRTPRAGTTRRCLWPVRCSRSRPS